MKVLKTDIMPDGTQIQVEEWNENYSFMPYGSTIASYPKSKMSHEGCFAPKGNEIYRFSFNFNSSEEADQIFFELVKGQKVLADLRQYMYDPKYADCL